jgi:hypothetical protein
MATYSISGIVVSSKRQQPLPGLRVEAWDKDMLIDDLLGTATTESRGFFILTFDQKYYKELVFDRKPDIYFKVYSGDRLVLDTSDKVLFNITPKPDPIMLTVPEEALTGDTAATYSVRGFILTSTSLPLGAVTVAAYDKGLEGMTLLASAVTASDGSYHIHYNRSALQGKTRADLLIRVFSDTKLTKEIGRSPVKYGAGALEAINLVLAPQGQLRGTEYDRLLAALKTHLGDKQLKDLKEEGDSENITYLAYKTGWDARAVAMAARAAALSSETGIPAAHYYAIFRVGTANDQGAINSMKAGTLEVLLNQAMDNGVIPRDKSIPSTIQIHTTNVTNYALQNPTAGAISSLGAMLDMRLNASQKNTFMEAFQATHSDPTKLWSELEDRGFTTETIASLQADAKLGFLTFQNVPLIQQLQQRHQVTRPEDLARAGLYKADAWASLVQDNTPEGLTPEEYAADLAEQVNLNYATLVTADMVRKGEINLEISTRTGSVAAFIESGYPNFEIGIQPIKTWDGFDALDTTVKTNLKTVERLYQMSPSNGAMVALFNLGLDSAYKVLNYSEDQFMTKFSGSFPDTTEARMAYNKSAQIQATALNFVTQYYTLNTNPGVYTVTGTRGSNYTESTPNPIVTPPTLENLFGNIDYCSCSHCRSVLSPAAYMVELLQFIDLKDVPHAKENPLDVLLNRRPDIEHILLSCENTNTTVPYIDLVNEVLEYYVVNNGSLNNFRGYNTPEGAVSADILADPQQVQDAAYEPTYDSVYPMTLPFDRSLEALRLIAESIDTVLPDALRIFQTPSMARREFLGLNQKEYDILVGTSGHTVPEFYGLASNATIAAVNNAISNAKVYARTVDIRYAELVEILKTRFINPGVDLVLMLEALKLTMAQISQYYAGTLTANALTALLPQDLDQTPYEPNVPQWLTDNEDKILNLIVLSDQHPEVTECDFGNMELRFLNPATNGNRLNMLAYNRLHRFIRIWKKMGWSIAETDEILMTLMPVTPDLLTPGNINGHFVTLLARLANLQRLIQLLKISKRKLPAWLALWDAGLTTTQRKENLALLLKMGLTDLEELILLTGFDPLEADMQADNPSLMNFIEAQKLLKASGPKVVDVDYVLRNMDLTGNLSPTIEALHTQVKQLKDAMTAIETALNVAPDNPDLQYARAKMALVYDNAVVTDFFGIVSNNTTYTAPYVLSVDSLPAGIAAADSQLGYDAFKGLLTYTGLMTAAAQTAINNAATLAALANLADFQTAVQALRDAGQADFDTLNTNYPELGSLYTTQLLPVPDDAARAQLILASILPALKDKLKDNALRVALVAILKTDQPSVDAFTSSPDVLHAIGNIATPVLTDLRALEDGLTLNANGIYDFYVDAPATDDYILYLKAANGTTLTLAVDGAPPVIATQTINVALPLTEGKLQSIGQISWTTGSFHALQLTVANLPASTSVVLSWRTKGMAKAAVPNARIYRATQVTNAMASLIRFQKASLLQTLLKFTPMEMAYFAGVNPDTRDILNEFTTAGPITGAAVHDQWQRLALLLQFALLKKENEPEQNAWVQLLQNPAMATPQGQSILLSVNGWTQPDLDAVLLHFSLIQSDLSSLTNLFRVRGAMALVLRAGYYLASDLRTWYVGNPTVNLITTIKGVIRERLDDMAWQETMKSVMDALRNKSRDALVTYILHHDKPQPQIHNADQLYEYFLIDVQMDACMLTSRIRMALSSIQLFVMRCMMNLEMDVSPESIRAQQWAWMKRYRVWEANRKIFLYPENWLEPELRDNKSPFYKELEGELLKSDITDELAEDALLNYLRKLDEVAYLEVVGSYLQEREKNNINDDILHVIGRTNGSNRQYYYRKFQGGSWFPWEKIGLQIEGDIVYPVIWKNRLFVFWLTVIAKPANAGSGTPSSLLAADWTLSAKANVEMTICFGEYHKGKWMAPKSSELKKPIKINDLMAFDPLKIRMVARTYTPKKPGVKLSEKLVFQLTYISQKTKNWRAMVTFTSKNAPPYIEIGSGDEPLIDKVINFNNQLLVDPYSSDSDFPAPFEQNSISWNQKAFKVNVKQPPNAAKPIENYILTTKLSNLFPDYAVRPLLHPVENQWNAAFFYRDEHSQFYVEPTEALFLVRDEPGYYEPKVPDTHIEIPPLIEVPQTIPDPINPVINPAWEVGNPQINVILPGEETFTYGNVRFGMEGQVQPGNLEGGINTGFNENISTDFQ